MRKSIFLALICLLVFSCREMPDPDLPVNTTENYFFPSLDNTSWETNDPDSLGWNSEKISALYDYLESRDTRAFILLYKGRIVLENYWGKTLLGLSDFNASSEWYWASAGKTITSFLIGKAQEDGLLHIDDATTQYLGEGWTSMTKEQENAIKIHHHLSMTTGADQGFDTNCNDPSCIAFKKNPGEEWYYHNGMYRLLFDVLAEVTQEDLNDYTEAHIEDKIGMNGYWNQGDEFTVYYSTARDMARFGILMQNKGNWDGEEILKDKTYIDEMINTSQDLNPSYGYLWWLNGKNSIVYPGTTASFPIPLSTAAPDDIFCAIGKNGQFLGVSPQKELIMVRMGDDPNDNPVPTVFFDEVWQQINEIIE